MRVDECEAVDDETQAYGGQNKPTEEARISQSACVDDISSQSCTQTSPNHRIVVETYASTIEIKIAIGKDSTFRTFNVDGSTLQTKIQVDPINQKYTQEQTSISASNPTYTIVHSFANKHSAPPSITISHAYAAGHTNEDDKDENEKGVAPFALALIIIPFIT